MHEYMRRLMDRGQLKNLQAEIERIVLMEVEHMKVCKLGNVRKSF